MMFVSVLYYFVILPCLLSLIIRRCCLTFLCLNFLSSCSHDAPGSLLCFVFSFLSRSQFFALTLSPIQTPAPPFSVREAYGVNMGSLLTKNQNVLHEISFIFIFSPPVSCFAYLDLDLLGCLLLLFPPFGFPHLSHRIIWCECGKVQCSCFSLSYVY